MKYNIRYNEKGIYEINGTEIDEAIFDKEKIDYRIEDRKEFINTLIGWISESDRESDIFLMKEDLKYLMNCKDEFLFSSILTNEYVIAEDDEKYFNEICEDLLSISKERDYRDTKRIED